jgi:hypothetical protein
MKVKITVEFEVEVDTDDEMDGYDQAAFVVQVCSTISRTTT